MQPGMMNPQMLAAQQQQQRPQDLQRFAMAQAQAQAQRQSSPPNPNAGPGSPAVGSSPRGHSDLQPSYPPGMQSNSLQCRPASLPIRGAFIQLPQPVSPRVSVPATDFGALHPGITCDDCGGSVLWAALQVHNVFGL